MAFLYIIKSTKNGMFYVGSSLNADERLKGHNSGNTKSTSRFRPWNLVFKKEYTTIQEARVIEYRLKKFKSRDILERIMSDKDIHMRP